MYIRSFFVYLDCEIRAHIPTDGYLEMGGRQAMLLGRLMDEFPPPEKVQEDKLKQTDQTDCKE